MNKFVLLLFLTFLLAACSPKVTTNLVKSYQALAPEDEVIVLDINDTVPENAVFLGNIKVGDSGFTTKNGSYYAVLSIAKEKAREAGGNIVHIKEHKSPNFASSIHRITADVYHISGIEGLSDISSFGVYNSEHPDYAVIYFYRPSGAGFLISYTVKVDGQKVFNAKNNSSAEVKIREAGRFEISAKTESSSSFSLDVKLGMEYYVCCSLDLGIMVGRPVLSLVSTETGKKEYEAISNK
ncbi:MAG: hypothetical protein IJ151_07040 [Bacteroidales bacterium]|nr:hypothetical protein [Bacteroidales bacterium]